MSFLALLALGLAASQSPPLGYPIVDTNQHEFFGAGGGVIDTPAADDPLAGQDAGHAGNAPSYRDNGDGTVSDLVTGLVWQKSPDTGDQVTYSQAVAGAAACRTGGHEDWRLPTIKELYSLMDFSGGMWFQPSRPYLDTRYFDFQYGDESNGARKIDSQWWTATEYSGRTMGRSRTVFGVNFADGRIKGYPRDRGPGGGRHWVRYVRGNPSYGINQFEDLGDGTVLDRATGLMWTKADAGRPMDWPSALAFAAAADAAGHDDWRLPDAKELQSIVDYSRSPGAEDPAARGCAIDPVFSVTDPESYFWSSTSHLEGRPGSPPGTAAVYVCFGRAMGFMQPRGGEGPGTATRAIDVHGAGAQRSDPKVGDASEFPRGRGPQGDDIRILNHVRLVRNASADEWKARDAKGNVPEAAPAANPPR